MIPPKSENRFQRFFNDRQYVFLKNYLYNYLLRKKAVEHALKNYAGGRMIEVGTGLSPVTPASGRTLYTDVSHTGLSILKNRNRCNNSDYVTADATALPFKTSRFSCCISSEVLEHVENDAQALQEMARITTSQGNLILTIPHRTAYYFNDDRYVNHHRRYDLADIKNLLKKAGFRPIRIEKVLGPLEKLTMSSVIALITLLKARDLRSSASRESVLTSAPAAAVFKWLNRLYMLFAWVDAKLMPLGMSSVLLIESRKL